MNGPNQEMVELFLQEASEHLQFLREYGGILQDPYPAAEDVERLYISAHGLAGTAGTYGYRLFSEVASKLAHIFQYATNANVPSDASAPLVEFIYEAVAVLESDLVMISQNAVEADDDIASFKQRYPFAFQAPAQAPETAGILERPQAPAEPAKEAWPVEVAAASAAESAPAEAGRAAEEVAATLPDLPPDGNLPQEVLEFFVPEVEEHLQSITDSLLRLEASPSGEEINRIFRAIHTIKGSSSQVGMQRISTIAHRAEDLIDKLREGALQPGPLFVDLCLESVDVLKKLVYRQWPDEASFQKAAKLLLARITQLLDAGKPEAPQREQEPLPAPASSKDEPELSAAPSVPQLTIMEAEGAAPAATAEAAAPPAALEEIAPPAIVEVPLEPALERPSARLPLPSRREKLPAEGTSTVPEMRIAPPLPIPPNRLSVLERLASLSQPESAKRDKPEEPEAVPRYDTGVAPSKSVRIALLRLDRMMNAVGELVINRTRMLGRLTELERLADVLNFSKGRMIDKISEFQDKYEFSRINHGVPLAEPAPATGGDFPFRGGYSSYARGFDPALAEFSELEMDRYDDFGILSRSLTEISADITEVLSQLDSFVRRVDGDIDEFTKLAHRLQDEITQARMVPIGYLYTRIARTVRDAAKAAGKVVEVSLGGAETELDNNIIQQIVDPLLHLVRNAVSHGIESLDERYAAGKPDTGTVAVRAYHRGNHIYIEVEDDGRGVDYQRVRTAAVEGGFTSREQAERMAERDLLDLLFRPGFSTAPRKTELSGRGVGLDVVRTNLNALNGEIEVETQKGIGTRFTLKVPLTLIISQALFVRNGAHFFAFPLGFVEEIRRIRESDIEEIGGKLLTKVRDVTTEVVRLDAQLGLPRIEPVDGYYRLVLVNVASRQVGIVVEEVLRKDEIVIKNLGEYLRNVKMFPGATIAPDGSLILLVDINRLIVGEAIEHRPLMTSDAVARLFAPGATAVAAGEIPEAAIDQVKEEKLVVLADDSISVRKFVGRMLEKAGYRVKLAADGLEALELASQFKCDLMITDLEMPRTNGYELMLHLRKNPETAHIPIMVVTSRAGSKHRERAMKQGATAFLVKPVQEDSFVAQVAELIGAPGKPASVQ